MFKFISFGSGSCGNCYYLYTENDGLLIDVGVGTRSLKKHFSDYGLHMLNGFSSILVTHDHADHIKSVGSLSKKFDIPVYATRLVHSGMDRNYCMKMKLAQANRRYVVKGELFEASGFRITPFAVPHDSSDNVGYMIEHEGVVFTLLTDVGHITEEMKTIIKNTNYLVIESNYDLQMLQNGLYPRYLQERIQCGTGHLSNAQCGTTLAENYTHRLKHVWLCHLSEENNHPELARKSIEQVLMDAGVKVGNDLLLDVLRRKQPTGVFELV